MKKIVLLTDFSESAKNAIEYALEIFSHEGAEYILLNVYTEPHTTTDMLVSIKDLLKKESERGLEKEYNYLKNKHPNKIKNIKLRSEYGELSPTVNRISEEETIDFIVMGTTGATGIQKVFFGSNTTDVVENVKCPVLAIPKNTKYKPLTRIGFATDYEELKYDDVLNPLIDLVKQYQANLMIVNIQKKEELVSVGKTAEISQLNHSLEEVPHLFYGIKHNNIVEGLEEFILENKVDLLAMVVRKHPFFERMLHTSVTKGVSMLAKHPILFLHE